MTTPTFAHRFSSPLGEMFAAVNKEGDLLRLEFLADRSLERYLEGLAQRGFSLVWDELRCSSVVQQLTEYFRKERRQFELALAPQGTPFQQKVWQELQRIPYGETISYSELARRLGNPKAVRAVGGANGANPIAIVIPCHRVIGANHSLTGYGGGLPIKQALLGLEKGMLFW